MAIKVSAESISGRMFDSIGDVPTRGCNFFTDETAGRIILAECVDYKGAEIYVADGIHSAEQMSPEFAHGLKLRSDIHHKLLPWMKVELDYHMDDGEEAMLTLQSQPDVHLTWKPYSFTEADDDQGILD